MQRRKQVLQLDLRASDQVKQLDATARSLHEALVEKRDVFKFVKDSFAEQSFQNENLHAATTSQITGEHRATRNEILKGMRAEHAETRRLVTEFRVNTTI